MAAARTAPLAASTVSCVFCAWKWRAVSRTGSPSSPARISQTAPAKRSWAFTPVPTAVPPSATSDSAATCGVNRSIVSSSWSA